MADTLNDKTQTVGPSTPQQPSTNQTSSQPKQAQQPEDTGSQYETTELPPEDLDARWLRWKCGVCNYTYEGSKPLRKCPRCGNEDQDKFLDAD